MTTWLIRRLIQALLVVLVMTVIVFLGLHVIGNPVDILISPQADQAERARAIAALGLDKPLWQQYLAFLGGALHGDLGNSFVFNEPALRLIAERMPATMELAVTAVLLSVVLGIPLGLYAGLYPDRAASRTIMAGSILGFSLPTFWVGLMLIMVFAVELGWLPSTGRGTTAALFGVQWSFLTWDGLRHMLMPAVNLALFNISLVLRLVRAGVREIVLMDYVKFARAKGLSPARVVFVHGDGDRAGVRLDHCVLGGDRERVRLAGDGQADHRFDQRAGPAGDRCVPDDDRAAVRDAQPAGGHSVYGAGPARAVGDEGMRGRRTGPGYIVMAGLDPAILSLRPTTKSGYGMNCATGGESAFNTRSRNDEEDGRIKHAPGRLTRGSGHDAKRDDGWGEMADSVEPVVQIVPSRIHGCDQIDLPGARPALDRRLALNGADDLFVAFGVDQARHPISLHEPRPRPATMLPRATREIAGDANIEDATWAIGQDVDPSALHDRTMGGEGLTK